MISPTGLDKQKFSAKIVNISYPSILTDLLGAFEYPQHMFWLRNKKIKFLLHTLT